MERHEYLSDGGRRSGDKPCAIVDNWQTDTTSQEWVRCGKPSSDPIHYKRSRAYTYGDPSAMILQEPYAALAKQPDFKDALVMMKLDSGSNHWASAWLDASDFVRMLRFVKDLDCKAWEAIKEAVDAA